MPALCIPLFSLCDIESTDLVKPLDELIEAEMQRRMDAPKDKSLTLFLMDVRKHFDEW